MQTDRHLIRLELPSSFEMLDLVQVLSDRRSSSPASTRNDALVSGRAGIRDQPVKHGNREDRSKHVTVEFTLAPRIEPKKFTVEVLDEGEGFDYEEVDDPLAPENLMKSSGRGIFFMRNFMDDVAIARRPEGGMSVRLVKNLQ